MKYHLLYGNAYCKVDSIYSDIEILFDIYLCCFRDMNSTSPVKFTYTAMHGVGYKYVLEAFKAFNFKPPIPVKQQVRFYLWSMH